MPAMQIAPPAIWRMVASFRLRPSSIPRPAGNPESTSDADKHHHARYDRGMDRRCSEEIIGQISWATHIPFQWRPWDENDLRFDPDSRCRRALCSPVAWDDYAQLDCDRNC